jgi:His-Xaa-Ser system protein HxsD
MIYKYNKDLYPKSALIKAAYHFTDNAYIHLDCNEDYYIVSIEPKAGNIIDEKTFENEMLAQTTRYEIFQQTKNIREISLARALASSVIEEDEAVNIPNSENDYNVDEIIKDWFEGNE